MLPETVFKEYLIIETFKIHHRVNQITEQCIEYGPNFVKLCKKTTYVPRKRLDRINNGCLSGGIMYVCIVSYFQKFSQHTCSIFLSEEKLNRVK